MISYVVFSCLNQQFGINIEYVKRILSAQTLTIIPDEEDHVEGMFKYEEEVLKVVSFRRLLGEKSYTQELQAFFPDLKLQHKAWLDALIDSVDNMVPFAKTTNPHACHLGKWIDSFHPDNAEVVEIMKHLVHHHNQLHHSAVDVLELRDTCQDKAHEWIESNVQDIYKHTLSYLEQISQLSATVAVDLQQCLVLTCKDNGVFGMNIDKVEDIIHVDEKQLHKSSHQQTMGSFMDIDGILNLDGKLVTIINNLKVL